MRRWWIAMACAASALGGCGSDPYGHARTYTAQGAEATAAEGAEDYDPVMVRRQPELWRAKKVAVFGVVVKRDDLATGRAYLTLSVRSLEARNLCETSSEDSCRTTVSEHEHDKVHVRLVFAAPEDDKGASSIGLGSLLRVIGKLDEGPDPTDGGEVLAAAYYRHWPRGYYVTTAAADVLRR